MPISPACAGGTRRGREAEGENDPEIEKQSCQALRHSCPSLCIYYSPKRVNALLHSPACVPFSSILQT